MTKMILGTLALVALLIPTTASAAAPNGMPDTTVENLTELAFSFSAGPFTDSRLKVWNRGGYANRRDVAACDGLVEADTTPRVAS